MVQEKNLNVKEHKTSITYLDTWLAHGPWFPVVLPSTPRIYIDMPLLFLTRPSRLIAYPCSTHYLSLLIGGLQHCLFFHILGIIIPIDFHIFQRCSHTIPPTRLSTHSTHSSDNSSLILSLPTLVVCNAVGNQAELSWNATGNEVVVSRWTSTGR